MPIKFPRFSRRKSVGNSLEGGYEPANTGSPNRPGFEDDDLQHPGEVYTGYTQQQRYNNSSNNNHNNSGSGYSGAYYGSSSSNRLSSSSTLPSSDAPRTPASADDHFGLPRTEKALGGGTGSNRDSDALSQLSPVISSGAKRSVGGTYSSGQMHRIGVGSSEPPKLEAHLDSISFEDMFAGFGTTNSGSGIGTATPAAPKLATSSLIPPATTGSSEAANPNLVANPPAAMLSANNANPPVPPPKSYPPNHVKQPNGIVAERINTWNAKLNTQSTQNMYSEGDSPNRERWHGRPSEEALVSLTYLEPEKISPRQSRNLTHSQPDRPAHTRKDSLNAPPPGSRAPRQHSKQSSGDNSGLKRTTGVSRRKSVPIEDADATLVMNNVHQQQKNIGGRNFTDGMKDRDSGWEEALVSGNSSANSFKDSSSSSSRDTGQTSISNRTPATSRQNTDETFTSVKIISSNENSSVTRQLADSKRESSIDFGSSFLAAAPVASKYEHDSIQAPEKPTQSQKVMTRAEFERYRQQQDEERRLGGDVDDEESDSESELDESDTEKKREIAKQRERQEAHLSVYRQQMMKITGSATSVGPVAASTPMLPFNNSMPQLSLSGPASTGGKSDDDDEEVPLGILMAHGFPNKNRPPTRLSNSSSQPNLRASAQQQQQSALDPRLPVFARNLPADPYNYGASLLNSVNRTTLGLGAGSDTRSVASGSVYGGHPGGLIGEIALAEEMKAARRGSPSGYRPFSAAGPRGSPGNGGGMLGLGGGMPSMGTGMMGMPQQPMMPSPQTIGNQGLGSDPMQMQMANQMQQMMQMQMQMQWMQIQQQQQMMQGGGQQMLNPAMIGQPRPNSMVVGQAAPVNMPMQQRTMSMLDPTPPQLAPQRPGYATSIAPSHLGPMMGLHPAYAPSIAPSERSTIGLPSRYRPVSTVAVAPLIGASRTSTMTSTAAAAWASKASKTSSGLKNATAGGDSDDDDDSAWEELKKKKLEKKDGWRKKKEGVKRV